MPKKTNQLRVWGRADSSNVKKVLWLADEMRLVVERIDAGREFGVVDTPVYRKLNPNGRVPTLEDGDFVLWESNSIMRYLAMKYAGELFYPASLVTRANIDRWLAQWEAFGIKESVDKFARVHPFPLVYSAVSGLLVLEFGRDRVSSSLIKRLKHDFSLLKKLDSLRHVALLQQL